ncbi:MAG: glycosyltransferase [Nanoarchaeota archaeon]
MISVIIPAYNEEKYIEKTLKLIPKNIEVIVVCNNCSDKTQKISKKYAKTYSIRSQGVSLARNYGGKKAKGDLLVFLDADTLINNELISTLNEIKNKNFFGTCMVKPDSKKFIARIYCSFKNLIGRLGIHNSSGVIFCSKNIFEKVKFDKKRSKHENQEFSERAKKYGKRYFLNCYTITSMRRFEKLGYVNVPLYWIKEMFHKTKGYPNVR